MSGYLFLDYESRSLVEIATRGVHNYASDPSTKALLLAYAFGDGDVQLWSPKPGYEFLLPEDMPSDLRSALEDPGVVKVAWNVAFERLITKFVFGIEVPIQQWLDVMVQARYCCLPDKLEKCCDALRLSENEGKIKDGKRLIDLFCKPAGTWGEMTLFGVTEPYFRTRERYPKDWELFCEYAKRDVGVERLILRKLWPFKLPERELLGHFLDQRINERGIPVDVKMLDTAIGLVDRARGILGAELKELTGLVNPNSRDQIMEWAKGHGYPYNSLGKKFVGQAMAEKDIDETCRRAFFLRKQLTKTSVEKYQTVKDGLCADGTVKDQLVYLGAVKTGRWASRGIQVHNLPRTPKAIEKDLDVATELVRNGDYEGIELMFGSVLDTVAGTVRSVFRAPEGKQFVICDFSAIENRVLGWLARCQKILNVFLTCEKCGHEWRKGKCVQCGCKKHRDPYKSFGVFLFEKDYALITKQERNDAKPGTLGAGYQLSGGEEEIDDNGDTIYTGMWGYAKSLGSDISRDLAHKTIKIFREQYDEVVKQWYSYEEAAITALKGKPNESGRVWFEKRGDYLTLRLPSGRCLNYRDAQIVRSADKRDKRKERESISYLSPKNARVQLYGGKFMENCCQAVARDLFLHAMHLAEDAGFHPVLHIHDEAVCLEDIDGENTVEKLKECMSIAPDWAEGLPLGADGDTSPYYRKL